MTDWAIPPASKKDIEDFNIACRRYWKMNIRKYFNRSWTKWSMYPKTDHRFLITSSGADPGGDPTRIQNAMVVKWSPVSGTINIGTAQIMVKSQSGFETVKIKKTSKRGIVYSTSKQRLHSLFRLLQEGTPSTTGAFVRSQGHYGIYGYRIRTGSRGPQKADQWRDWMNNFIYYVDMQLELLANKLEQRAILEMTQGRSVTVIGDKMSRGRQKLENLSNILEEF